MNTPIPGHPMIGAEVTYRPDCPDATHLPAHDYVVRNGDTCTVLAVFHDWNQVSGLTMFRVEVPATGNRTYLSPAECGINDPTAAAA